MGRDMVVRASGSIGFLRPGAVPAECVHGTHDHTVGAGRTVRDHFERLHVLCVKAKAPPARKLFFCLGRGQLTPDRRPEEIRAAWGCCPHRAARKAMPHIERSIVSLRGRDAAEVAVFEPGAVAFQRDHLGVVDQAVELGEATKAFVGPR